MENETGVIDGYIISLITFILFSNDDEQRYAQSLLKINNKIELKKKVINISWDITFIRYINDLASRCVSQEDIGDNYYNYVLITKDKALGNISSLLISDSSYNFDGKYVTNIIIDDDKIHKEYRDSYMKIRNSVMNEEKLNKRIAFFRNIDPVNYIKQLLNLIDELLDEYESK